MKQGTCRRVLLRGLILSLILVTGVSTALAQNRMEKGPRSGRRDFGAGERPCGQQHDPDRREKAQQMMLSLKIWKLTEELQIDEKLSEKLYPRIRELEALRFGHHQALEKAITDLRIALKNMKENPEGLERQVEKAKAIRESHVKAEGQIVERILELLSPEQQAKYLLVEADFHQDIRRFVRDQKRSFKDADGGPPTDEPDFPM